MFRNVPHTLSDARLGLLILLMAAAYGACRLYNAWRLGKLPWKPKGPANPKRVGLVVFLGILLVPVLVRLLT